MILRGNQGVWVTYEGLKRGNQNGKILYKHILISKNKEIIK